MSNYQKQISRTTAAQSGAVDLTSYLPSQNGYRSDEHQGDMDPQYIKAHPSLIRHSGTIYVTPFRDTPNMKVDQPGISFTEAMRINNPNIDSHWMDIRYVLPKAFHLVPNGNLIIHWPGYEDVVMKIMFYVPEQRRSCTKGEVARQIAIVWKKFYDINKDKAPAYPTDVSLGSNAIRYEDIRFAALYTMGGNTWYLAHSFVRPTIKGCDKDKSQVGVLSRLHTSTSTVIGPPLERQL